MNVNLRDMMRRTAATECESVRIDAESVRRRCEISAKMIRNQFEIDPKRCESMRIDAIDVKGCKAMAQRSCTAEELQYCIFLAHVVSSSFRQRHILWCTILSRTRKYCKPHLQGGLVRRLPDYLGSPTVDW